MAEYSAEMAVLHAGADYPGSLGEFQAWFGQDGACLDYLEWLRWPDGFVCPRCGHAGGWRLGDGRFQCTVCSSRSSVTAGTIFDKTRTPLTVWFTVCWMFATSKEGVSAQGLQRTLEFGSYHTAWEILHRLRSVLVRPDRERLAGRVEVDETYIGGVEPGLPGGRAKGKKVLTAVAVESDPVGGLGRCRLAPIPDATGQSLRDFIAANVEPGSRIVTDGWNGYRGVATAGYIHEQRSQRAAKARGEDPGALLPGVHRVASLAKRWLLGTHQASVKDAHLTSYLEEFAFRFNRRRSHSRGLLFYRVLELAVAHEPVRRRDLVAEPKPTGRKPIARGAGRPLSLDRPQQDRP